MNNTQNKNINFTHEQWEFLSKLNINLQNSSQTDTFYSDEKNGKIEKNNMFNLMNTINKNNETQTEAIKKIDTKVEEYRGEVKDYNEKVEEYQKEVKPLVTFVSSFKNVLGYIKTGIVWLAVFCASVLSIISFFKYF